MPTLNIDLFDVLISCCDGTLNQINIDFSKSKSICVVLCSKGYPEKFENNIKIKDLEQSELLITKELVSQLKNNNFQWDQEAIEKRQQELAELSYSQIWNI